jgi:hypothetical protein
VSHWRTSRATSGAQPLPGSPHGGKYAPPANLIRFPSGSPLERCQISEPTLDECSSFTLTEIALIVVAPSLVVIACVIGYLALVA